MLRMNCLTFVIILAVAIQFCLGQVPVNSTRLSSPRKAMSSVAVGDRVMFVGGYDFHDSSPSDRIDVFDAINQTWIDPLFLPVARGYVSPVAVDSNVYLLGGITRTNSPYLYQSSNHSFVPLGSGPTVRSPKQLSIFDSSLTVVGSFSADFLDLNTGNWTYNSNLTKLMTSRKDAMTFAYQNWIFVIGGVDVDLGVDLYSNETSSDAWVFNSQTNELKEYTAITTYNVTYNPLAPFTYAGSNDVVVVRLPDRCLMYHLTHELWVEQLNAVNIANSVTVNNITYLFGNNIVLYDWTQINVPEYADTNVWFAFAMNNRVVYFVDGEVVFVGGPRVGQTGLTPSGPVRFAQEWTATHYIFADDFVLYVVNMDQEFLAEIGPFTYIISMFISADGNLHVFDTTDTLTWHIYAPGTLPTQVLATTHTFYFEPSALVDGDFVDIKSGVIPVTDQSALYPFGRNAFVDPVQTIQDGNTFIVMYQNMQPRSYEQYKKMDIYNYEDDTWTTVDMPGELFLDPLNKSFAETFINVAAINDTIMAWVPGATGVFDINPGNWTVYTDAQEIDGRIPVLRTSGLQHLHFEVPVINDFAYVHSDGMPYFYKFAPDLLNFTSTAPVPITDIGIQQPVANREKLYVAMRGEFDITEIYFYDTVSGVWQSTLLPVPSPYVAMAASEDYIIVIGSSNKLQILSVQLGQWNVQDLEYEALPSTIIHVGGVTLIAGGKLPSQRYSDTILIVSDDIVFIEQPSAVPSDASGPLTDNSPVVGSGLTVGELVAAIVVPIVVVLGAGLAVLLVMLKKRKKSKRTTTVGLEQQFGEWFTPFNDIQFGQQLGQGANGQVFKGKWKNTDVALKVSMTQANQSVIAELTLMINMRPHPNVVQLFGYSVHPETNSVILILEFCNGGSLDDYLINQNTQIPIAEKVQLMQGIARGVVHLHSNNIVHRDLAARNILLHQGEPKITDFGMSRVVDEQQQRGTTKSELGPIRWMAPESLKSKQYSTKSDVWSFGIVMYEVIEQQEPHVKADPITIGRQIRDEGLTPQLGASSSCPSAISSLMQQCWQMSPEKRPSMENVLQTLEQIS